MKAYLSFVYLAFPLGERFSLTSGPTVMASPHPQWPARQRRCRGFAGMSLPSAATPQYPTKRLIYDQNGVINTLLMGPLRPAHCKGRCRVLLFYFISTFFCFVNWSSKLLGDQKNSQGFWETISLEVIHKFNVSNYKNNPAVLKMWPQTLSCLGGAKATRDELVSSLWGCAVST